MEFKKAEYGNVIIAGLIDAVLIVGFFIWLFATIPDRSLKALEAAMDPNLIIVIGFLIYRMFFISISDRTPGMKILLLRFLNSEEKPLNIIEKLLASVFVLFKGVDYYKRTG